MTDSSKEGGPYSDHTALVLGSVVDHLSHSEGEKTKKCHLVSGA